jgi:hypothetical protein
MNSRVNIRFGEDLKELETGWLRDIDRNPEIGAIVRVELDGDGPVWWGRVGRVRDANPHPLVLCDRVTERAS